MLTLVLLRLAIGWHFTSEGIKHHQEANWSSESFLRGAKGPFAPQFQSKLPDDYGWEALMRGQDVAPPAAERSETTTAAEHGEKRAAAESTARTGVPDPRPQAAAKPAPESPKSGGPPEPAGEPSEPSEPAGEQAPSSAPAQPAAEGPSVAPPAAAPAAADAAPAPPSPVTSAAAAIPSEGSAPGPVPPARTPAAKPSSAPAAATDEEFKKFQALFDGFNKLSAEQQEEARNLFVWLQRTSAAWERYARQFENFYHVDEASKVKVQAALERRQRELTEWAASNLEAICKHGHEWSRWSSVGSTPLSEKVPYQKKRVAENQARLSAEAASWLSTWRGIENEFRNDLRERLTAPQLASADFPPDQTELRRIDAVMKHAILGIGLCLVVGLFTRLASVAGAAFLLSVALTQPFWVAGTQPTYNQIVEMLALLVLATTPVGRWGGLDFFIYSTFGGKCCACTKGT